MGVLRLILALAVVFDHASAIVFTGGKVAVEGFYIISGFYMALILDTAYRDKLVFYTNRLLRLFPAYWFVAALTVVFFAITGRTFYEPTSGFSELPLSAKSFLVFVNLALVGQDLTMFLGTDGTHLYPVVNFENSTPPLYHFLLVPPAWSLGVELWFYLLAPMLLRWRTRYLILLVMLSFSYRFYLMSIGLSGDPWDYRFFPLELAMFLSGALAYRAYARYKDRIRMTPIWGKNCALVFIWVLASVYAMLPVHMSIEGGVFYICLVILLPVLFEATRSSAVDRLIGDLSYPTYVGHMLVIAVLDVILVKTGFKPTLSQSVVAVSGCALSVIAAYVIYKVAETPVHRIREQRRQQAA